MQVGKYETGKSINFIKIYFMRITTALALILLLQQQLSAASISIALHAQVSPLDQSGGVVGSVITTVGLRDALLQRADVSAVSIFYPGTYKGYLDNIWDLVLIEGWFPSMRDFISLTRNKFSAVKIVFFCLDPGYPGLSTLETFDFDGILTNSRMLTNGSLLKEWNNDNRVAFMMLAANIKMMAPNRSISREWGAVYIGAGGNMLEYKPKLYQLLVDAIPYKLRLHGSNWDHVPLLKDIWLGPLPVDDISNAYNSAEVVLASTVQNQEDYGMINNRIFEALSCGSIVILSNYCPAIYREFGDLVLYVNATQSLPSLMGTILSSKLSADNMRKMGREAIIMRHSWSHRAVDVINFYHQIPPNSEYHQYDVSVWPNLFHNNYPTRKCCFRPNCPEVLIIVSETLQFHWDILQVILPGLYRMFCGNYNIQIWSGQQWQDSLSCVSNVCSSSSGALKDILVAVVTPFDAVDATMRALARPRVSPMQKIAAYIVGFDAALLPDQTQSDFAFNHYDIVWYRDAEEIDLWRSAGLRFIDLRLQHAFGAGEIPIAATTTTTTTTTKDDPNGIVFVCFWRFATLCTMSNRRMLAQENHGKAFTLLLLGGRFSDWVDSGDVLTIDIVPTVLHVGDGNLGEAGVQAIQAAKIAYFMYGASSVSTVEDVLWPFIAAAVSGCRIHLLQSNQHILAVLSGHPQVISPSDWDRPGYLMSMLRLGMDRLVGFGSAVSSMVLQNFNFESIEQASQSLTQRELDYLRIINRKEDIIGIVQLTYNYFHVGKEGQCCYKITNIARTNYSMDDAICMLRPFRFLVLTSPLRKSPCSMSEVCHSPAVSMEIDLHAFLRGTFYSDVIFSVNYSLPTLTRQSLYWLSQLPSQELDYKDMGFLSNVFYTHSIEGI